MPTAKIFWRSPLSRLSYYLVTVSQPESKRYVLSIFASGGRPRPAPVTGLFGRQELRFFLYDTFRQLTSQKLSRCSGFFFLLPRFGAEFLFTTRLTCALTITKYVAVRNMCVFCICFCAVCLSKCYVFHFLQ